MNVSKSSSNTTPNGQGALREPWPDYFVSYKQLLTLNPDELQRIVDAAYDERPIQHWFENHPATLIHLLSGSASGWVFGRPRLGSEFIPDLMICNLDSRGYQWHLIELESPRYSVLTQKAEQSAVLTHAVQQIRDWRIWLRNNVQYAQNELGYRELDAEFKGYVVLGRRKGMNKTERARYRELSRDGLTVMTYDRLIEGVSTLIRVVNLKG